MFIFKKPKNELETMLRGSRGDSPNITREAFVCCPGCKKAVLADVMEERLQVCPKCGHHLKVGARARLLALCDEDSFAERDSDLSPANVLDFPEYEEKLAAAAERSGEREGVVTGRGKIEGQDCYLFAMDGAFMMGSMGCVVGEKITRLFEYAAEENLPVVGFTLSGGARMQEGILSLMRDRQLRHGGGHHLGRAGGPHLLRRPSCHRADHPAEAATRLPAGGVFTGEGLCGRHRPPARAQGRAG